MIKIEVFSKWLLRISIIISLIYTIFMSHWVGTLGGIIILVATFLVDYLSKRFLKIESIITTTVYLYCIFSLVMGSMLDFYDKIWWWDLLMHILSGVILGVIGNVMLNRNKEKNKVTKLIRFLFIVGIACIGGVVWEIYEFSIDSLFNLDTQLAKNYGVSDTMWDLIMDFIGGLIFAVWNRHSWPDLFNLFIYFFLSRSS